MSWERLWKLDMRRLDLAAITNAAQAAAASYAGVTVSVDWEDDDTVSCFFQVPARSAETDPSSPDTSSPETSREADDLEVEISIYDLARDGRVLSLEGEAADNDAAFDDASQLAEDMADALGGRPLDV